MYVIMDGKECIYYVDNTNGLRVFCDPVNIQYCIVIFQSVYLGAFFWDSWENHIMTPPAHGVHKAGYSVRLLLTINSARSFSCRWCQVHGISYERFSRLWQTHRPISVPCHCPDSSLAFFKEGGVLFRSYAVPGSLAQSRLMS